MISFMIFCGFYGFILIKNVFNWFWQHFLIFIIFKVFNMETQEFPVIRKPLFASSLGKSRYAPTIREMPDFLKPIICAHLPFVTWRNIFVAARSLREMLERARMERFRCGTLLHARFFSFLALQFRWKSLCSEFGHLVVRWPKFTRFVQFVIE